MIISKLWKSVMATCLALVMGATALATSTQPAEARRGHGWGIAAGIIAGAAIAGAAYGYPRYYSSRQYVSDGCYLGPRQCRRVGGACYEDRFGDTVCRGGSVRCYRPTICD